MEPPFPLGDNEIDAVTDFAHALCLWATGRKTAMTAAILADRYDAVHGLLAKGNIDLDMALLRAEPIPILLVDFIDFKNERLKAAGGDEGTVDPVLYRTVLEQYGRERDLSGGTVVPPPSWMEIRRKLCAAMEYIEPVRSADAAMAPGRKGDEAHPCMPTFRKVLHALTVDYLHKVQIPGRKTVEQDIDDMELHRYAPEESKHIADVEGVFESLMQLSAAIVSRRLKLEGEEKQFFSEYMRKECELQVPGHYREPLEQIDMLLIKNNVGDGQRRQINRALGGMAKGLSAEKTR